MSILIGILYELTSCCKMSQIVFWATQHSWILFIFIKAFVHKYLCSADGNIVSINYIIIYI